MLAINMADVVSVYKVDCSLAIAIVTLLVCVLASYVYHKMQRTC